jgi:cysteinyl-tRNA synthetase, unknown class
MTRLIALIVLLLATAPALALDKPRDFVPPPPSMIPNFREQARDVVLELALYAKKRNPAFQVLMRGGSELLVKGELEMEWDDIHDPDGTNFIKRLPLRATFRPLVQALDGIVMDGLYCGPFAFDKPLAEVIKARKTLDAELDAEKKRGIHRPPLPVEMGPFSNDPEVELRRFAEMKQKLARAETQRRVTYALDAMRSEGRNVLTIESCDDKKALETAYRDAIRDHVTPYVKVGDGPLEDAPRAHPSFENAKEILTVANARNWLPVLRSDKFGTKGKFVEALANTNYDILLVDVVHRRSEFLVKSDVQQLKFKKLGPRRLVFAVMPLGRAYDWRWYWQSGWEVGNPAFIFAHDDKPGTYLTDLGSGEWRGVLGKYMAGIVDLGFDGVVFDDVGTYLWFEDLMPLGG